MKNNMKRILTRPKKGVVINSIDEVFRRNVSYGFKQGFLDGLHWPAVLVDARYTNPKCDPSGVAEYRSGYWAAIDWADDYCTHRSDLQYRAELGKLDQQMAALAKA